MGKEVCSNCKYSQLVWLSVGETQGGIHSSDERLDMYVCRHRGAVHYGHMMLGDHSCLGFKEIVSGKKLKERRTERYN